MQEPRSAAAWLSGRQQKAFTGSPGRSTMRQQSALLLALVALATTPAVTDAAGGLIYSLLRNNLAGTADNFKTQRWVFDPDAAGIWGAEYRRVNGIRGEDFIERIGLGEDAFQEQRRLQQAERDRGVYVSRQPLHGP